jgi:hypothetical protein
MGTQEEEARTLQEQQQRETQARLDFIQQQKDMAERQAAAEAAAKKAAEDALVNGTGSGNMVADEPVVASWPDNEVQAPPGRLDAVKGALAVGAAGDAALAAKLLNSGQAPLGSATPLAKGTDGAKEGIASASAAKPALGLG